MLAVPPDDEAQAQPLSGLGDGHVVLAQVYAVGLQLQRQLHVVVDNERGAAGTAQGLYLHGRLLPFVGPGLLHAELYPAASARKGHARRIYIRIGFREMGDELQVQHGLYRFNRYTTTGVTRPENKL